VQTLHVGRHAQIRPRQVMTAAELEAGRDFGRYLDVDGDGIPYRTYPGTASHTRLVLHARHQPRPLRALHEEAGPYVDNMDRLLRKFATAAKLVPQAVRTDSAQPTRFGVIHYGSTSPAMSEALSLLGGDGLDVDALRVRGFPFGAEVAEFVAGHERIFVVEQNRDAQLRTLLVNELEIDPKKLVPVLHYDGTPITARFISGAIGERLKSANVLPLRKAAHDLSAEAQAPSPGAADQQARLHAARLRGLDLDAMRGLRPRLDLSRDHPGLLRARPAAASHRQALGHRLLVEDADLFPRRQPRLQLGARPHAVGAHRRQSREPRSRLSWRLGRRRQRLDRARQFAHALRRGVNMMYIVENNGVYGLTKGQFSATADAGSLSKRGAENRDAPIDLVAMALQLGATFVARSFSGDKQQLVPLLKAAILHQGAAFIDCISPCVAFNNHAGSTKSFDYVRAHNAALNRLDVMPPRAEITAEYEPGETHGVKLHDGSTIYLRKVAAEHDVHDKVAAMNLLLQRQARARSSPASSTCTPTPTTCTRISNTLERPFQRARRGRALPGRRGAAEVQRGAALNRHAARRFRRAALLPDRERRHEDPRQARGLPRAHRRRCR